MKPTEGKEQQSDTDVSASASNGLLGWCCDKLAAILPTRTERLEIRFVTYAEGDRLIKQGWRLAKEEDSNRSIGYVYVEKVVHLARRLPFSNKPTSPPNLTLEA